MTMPEDLVFVRHGESEGNIAFKKEREGDESCFTDEFLCRHNSDWRLTDKGIKQAKMAGEWIKKNLKFFHKFYTSEYLRAMETAAYLNLPEASWIGDFYLRERDNGDLEHYNPIERRNVFKKDIECKKHNDFLYIPTSGESLSQLCLRADRFLHILHTECSNNRVIVVCHGELIRAFRIRIERKSQKRYQELSISENSHHKIFNGQIVHYTRRYYPDGYWSAVSDNMIFVRSVCPNNLHLSSNEWERIERPRYSNRDLLEKVNKTKRMINE
jgi:broad specificity phosphatase PhoE